MKKALNQKMNTSIYNKNPNCLFVPKYIVYYSVFTYSYPIGILFPTALIIDEGNKFLIIQKKAYKDNEWTFVGGGREEGETLEESVFREIKEETGMDRDEFELIKISKHLIKYNYPVKLARKIHGGRYVGQINHQVFLRFKGDKNKMKFNDEIRTCKWVEAKELKKYLIFPNQYTAVKRAIQETMPKLLSV